MEYKIRIKPTFTELIAKVSANSYDEAIDKLFKSLESKFELTDETEYNNYTSDLNNNEIFNNLKNIFNLK